MAGLPNIENAAFCPPGERIAVPDGRQYRVVDAMSGRALAIHPTSRPCRQVRAFLTDQGLRMLVDDRTEAAPFLSLVDGSGAALSRAVLSLDRDHPDEMSLLVRAAISRDGKRVACQSRPLSSAPAIEVFDTTSGRRIANLRGPGAIFQAIAFSPDGTQIAAAMESTQMLVFDVDAGRLATTVSGHSGAVRAVVFTPDGLRLASCGDDQTIRVWDMRTYKTLSVLRGHAGSVSCLAVSPDGKWLVSGGIDGTVRIWGVLDPAAGLTLHGHTAGVTQVAYTPLATRSPRLPGMVLPGSGMPRRWPTPACFAATRATSTRWRFVLSVAGSPRVRGTKPSAFGMHPAAPGSHARCSHATLGALAFTPDGARLASWAEDQTIRIWDTSTGNTITCLAHESMGHRDSVYSLIVSPDGKRLGAVSRDGIRFWDLATYAERPRLRLPLAGIRVAAFSPDGTRIAAGGDDSKVVIANAESGSVIAELTGFKGRIQSLAFSPDGRSVLTAGRDPTLRLWDATTGVLLRTYTGHGLEVLSAVFHPDGSRIASGGHDRSILIWDTATGDELVRLPGHAWYVFSLAFSPDGETLVSGSGDATVRLWDAFPVVRRLRARREAF